jgi:hypothetical protein
MTIVVFTESAFQLSTSNFKMMAGVFYEPANNRTMATSVLADALNPPACSLRIACEDDNAGKKYDSVQSAHRQPE